MLTKNQVYNLHLLVPLMKHNIRCLCLAFINSLLKPFLNEKQLEDMQNVDHEEQISENMVKTLIATNDERLYEALFQFYMDLKNHMETLLNVFPLNEELLNDKGLPVSNCFILKL